MALIDQIVTVNIVATQGTPSLPGTDVPAFIGFHTKNTDLIRSYFDTAGMLADGFTALDPLFRMATAHCSQNPRGSLFKIIRGTTSVVQVLHFKVTNNNPGAIVGLILTDAGGVNRVLQITVVAQTLVQIAAAIAAISVPGATLVVNGGDTTQVDITITATGAIWYPSAIFGGNYTDTTPTANPQTDLANAALIDPNFYGVAGTWNSPANISAIGTWVDSNARLHAYQTTDTNNLTLGQGVFSTLKATSSNRNYGQFCGTPATYGAVGLMANRFTDDAGSDTWAFVTIIGTPPDSLTPSQISAATSLDGAVSNNGNVYVSGVANTNCTLTGLAASGLFIDLQRGIDALSRDMQVAVFAIMKAASDAGKKVPYTRKGASQIAGGVRSTLQNYVDSGFLSGDAGFEFSVNVPDPNNATASDKSKRIYRNINWTAVATGAIQTVKINGSISF